MMFETSRSHALETKLEWAARLLSSSKHVVAFTGAGISAPSGIPTFREGGLWDHYPPEIYGTPWGLRRLAKEAPEDLRVAIVALARTLLGAEPNAAHRILAAWETRGLLQGVVTQNVDDLHERAGSRRIAKLHGDLARWRCVACGAPAERAPATTALLDSIERSASLAELLGYLPRCRCGAWLRPDVVLFGEMLPTREVAVAGELLKEADLVLSIGTSGLVEPAAGLLRRTLATGAKLVEVNPVPSAFTNLATIRLPLSADEALLALEGFLESEA